MPPRDPNLRRTICDHCGKPMSKAHAVHDGKGYCQACYCRVFKPVFCEKCGATTRTPGGVGPAVCKACRTLDRQCVRCGKDVPQAGLIVGDGVACPSCARYFKEPRYCPVCGQMSFHLSRDFKNGFTEPVCQQCRRKGHITCPSCGKNRRPAGTTTDGRVVCATCLATDGKPFLCPKCGKEGRRHSAERCEECYWTDNVDNKLKGAVAMLSREWVREAFSGFIPALAERVGVHVATLRLERHFLFFAKLDACIEGPEAATEEAFVAVFGAEGLRRHAAAYGYLIKSNLINRHSANALKRAVLESKMGQLLRACEERWYNDLLIRFRDHLRRVGERYADRGWVGEKERFGPRTILGALRSASKFLDSLDPEKIRTVQQIEQVHLELFIASNKGYRDGVRAFVRYLNKTQKLFKKLEVVSISRNLPPDVFVDSTKYLSLIKEWIAATDDSIKEALIGMLMLLYAQRAKQIVRLRLSDIAHGHDGVYRVIFGKTEIPLDRRVGTLLDRYLPIRKALAVMEESWENDYLFTGRATGDHLTEAAVSYYLKKHGVTAEQLFATSILYAYLSGLRHPKVLVKAFGIRDITAIKYLNLINPRLRDEVEMKVVNG